MKFPPGAPVPRHHYAPTEAQKAELAAAVHLLKLRLRLRREARAAAVSQRAAGLL